MGLVVVSLIVPWLSEREGERRVVEANQAKETVLSAQPPGFKVRTRRRSKRGPVVSPQKWSYRRVASSSSRGQFKFDESCRRSIEQSAPVCALE